MFVPIDASSVSPFNFCCVPRGAFFVNNINVYCKKKSDDYSRTVEEHA